MANEITIHVREQGTAATGNALKGLQGIAVGVAAGLVVAAAQMASAMGGMVVNAAKTGIAFNAMKEQAQIAFTSMLGSGEKAASLLAELQSFAAKTPFEFPELLEGSQKLLAMGFAAKDLIPTMTALGDATAAMGGNSVMIDRLTLAMGQMLAKGKVSGEEMRQFAEAGIPAWDFLAKKLGVTIPEAMKLSEKGAIDATTGIAALTEGMNSRFGGMMEQQAQTFSGLISTLKDNARIFAGEVMKPLFEDMKATLQDFSKWWEANGARVIEITKSIMSVIGMWAEMMGKWAKWIYDVFIAPIVGWLGSLMKAWEMFGNQSIDVIENWANSIIGAVNKVLETLGKFTAKFKDVPGIGDKLPQFGSETIAPLDLSRFRPGLGKGGLPTLDEMPNVMAPAASAAAAASTSGVKDTLEKVKEKTDEWAEAMARIMEDFQREQIEAYVEGGEEAFVATKQAQDKILQQALASAATLHNAYGIAVPASLDIAIKAGRALASAQEEIAKRTVALTQQLWAAAGGDRNAQAAGNLMLLAQAAEAANAAGPNGTAAANAILNGGGTTNVYVSGIVGDPVATGQAIAATLNAAAQGGPVLNSGAVGE